MITEVGVYQRVVGSATRVVLLGFEGGAPFEYVTNDMGNQLTFEVGAMRNRSATTAIGATAMASFGTGGSLAVKGRYRRWLSTPGLSLDLGAGPALIGRAYSRTGANTPGLTADVALTARDFGAVVARVDLQRTDGKTASALYGGVRLGSQPALVASGVLAVGFVLILQALREY